MARLWDADVDLDMEVAVGLIERQFPSLSPVQLEPLGVGWDNTAYLANGRSVFRFPRRQIAVPLLLREARLLPRLAPRLPAPLPAPEYVGQPTDDFPCPFVGYALIPGVTACQVGWTDADRARLAPALAAFLRALHAIPIEVALGVDRVGDELGRADLRRRAPVLLQRLNEVAPFAEGIDLPAMVRLVESLASAPPNPGLPCWVHGDLYARHLLIDDSRQLGGVIDWGDVHLGDPALDLSIAFSFLPPSARDAFRLDYGSIADSTWARARFRALHYGVLLLAYGHDIGDTAIAAAGSYALRSAAE